MKGFTSLVTVASVAATLVTVVACGDRSPVHPRPVTTPRQVIMEDDPGWDCRTMGNRSCVAREAD